MALVSIIVAVTSAVFVIGAGGDTADLGQATLVDVPTPTPLPTPGRSTVPGDTSPTWPAGVPYDAGGPALVDQVDEVVLVGDSLAEGAAPVLTEILSAAGVALRVDARSGRGTAEGARALSALAPGADTAIVVLLGTNDPDDGDQMTASAEQLLAAAPAGASVRWLNVARDGAEPINEALADVVSTHPDAELVDWSAVVADNPQLLVADRIHFTSEGYATLAAFIAREVLGLSLPVS